MIEVPTKRNPLPQKKKDELLEDVLFFNFNLLVSGHGGEQEVSRESLGT